MKFLSVYLFLPFILIPFSNAPEIPPRNQNSPIEYSRQKTPDLNANFAAPEIVKTPIDGGIKESIPQKFQERYLKWKGELLSTDVGRSQWEKYSNNKQFILTVTVSSEIEKGAKTDKYLWDEEGNFVGATITLGSKADRGFPDPVYYPVMNSLSTGSYLISGDVLAATKFAHEIGHVNQTFDIKKDVFQTQAKLVPAYIEIFLKNGYNSNDTNLVKMAEQMGGTPMQIWENREYWSEVNAMYYIDERINKENVYCTVFNKIRENVEQYAQNYKPRFERATDPVCGR